MSDSIIDFSDYLRRRDTGGEQGTAATFALWGAEGERSRFALPLWRIIYLAGGERGGILWSETEGVALHPLVVLDLAQDPARTEFQAGMAGGVKGEQAPELVAPRNDPSLTIYLGERNDRRWFLVVDGSHGREIPLPARDREDILFLAGECAGLLFLRDFADDAEREEHPE